MCWLLFIAFPFQVPPIRLFCENRFGPFIYFPLPTGTLPSEGTVNTLQQESFCFLVLVCWLGKLFQDSLLSLLWTWTVHSGSSTQQRTASPGMSLRQFCSKGPPVGHLCEVILAAHWVDLQDGTRMTFLPSSEPHCAFYRKVWVSGLGGPLPWCAVSVSGWGGEGGIGGRSYSLYLLFLFSSESSLLLANQSLITAIPWYG